MSRASNGCSVRPFDRSPLRRRKTAANKGRDEATVWCWLNLPGLSGLELGRRLIAEGRARSIIFITGQDDATLRDEAQRLGCVYFRKPFDGKALLEAIRRAIKFI